MTEVRVRFDNMTFEQFVYLFSCIAEPEVMKCK